MISPNLLRLSVSMKTLDKFSTTHEQRSNDRSDLTMQCLHSQQDKLKNITKDLNKSQKEINIETAFLTTTIADSNRRKQQQLVNNNKSGRSFYKINHMEIQRLESRNSSRQDGYAQMMINNLEEKILKYKNNPTLQARYKSNIKVENKHRGLNIDKKIFQKVDTREKTMVDFMKEQIDKQNIQ
ncbi:Hypothetical_protein [Hexamita inflata]|uniref:Hypothetical_protein n=1 Tax=Hexamita inflata TaxID=28002 RepID=A0AA86P877_9EUKA|nr:Hypothetical protein HINF_LOCUS20408 [Hexamita inflata]